VRSARAAEVALAVAAALGAGCGAPRSGVAVETLWAEHCAACHGADGRGTRARRTLEPRLDLARSEMIARGDQGLVFQRIAYGYAAMPGFAHKLPRGDIEQLAALAARLAGR
jgi:mono/diheme cytochrome c family protein